MAQSVHLELVADGNNIEGDSTVTSLERADTIEWTYQETGATHSWHVTTPS